jgi:hypothetical protein
MVLPALSRFVRAVNTVHGDQPVWPTGAANMPFDQPHAYRGAEEVQLTTPGLYVFVCKLHPFMLGGVIVDDPATQGLDLGKTTTLLSGATVPTASNLALRLVRSFINITNPQNYQVYTKTGSTWDPTYPAVPVLATRTAIRPRPRPRRVLPELHEPVSLPASIPPTGGASSGLGRHRDEQTAGKRPGTATAVNASDWSVTRRRRVAVGEHEQPAQHVDEPVAVAHHQTGGSTRNSTSSITDGRARAEPGLGETRRAMTRVDTDQVHVAER